MNQKILAIISLVFGMAIFAIGLGINYHHTKVRPIGETVIVSSSIIRPKVVQIEEVNVVGSAQPISGKAHVKHNVKRVIHQQVEPASLNVDLGSPSVDLGSPSVDLGSPSGGLFSTAKARGYNPGRHYSVVPRVSVVDGGYAKGQLKKVKVDGFEDF